MRNIIILLTAFLMITADRLQAQSAGKLDIYESFPSEFVDSREVDVWLPEGYSGDEGQTFPVIYMHDGQNLFDNSKAGYGEEWGVDEAITKLSGEGKIPEVIVVGIWNTAKRYREYMPGKVFLKMERRSQGAMVKKFQGPPQSDQYLKFIVEELKPFIDSVYRTKPDRNNTFIMGSSMGGLISLYTVAEYPQYFKGAGCLSSHWIGNTDGEHHQTSDAFVTYLEESLPDAGGHKFYFDYGTITLDSLYEPHQKKIDVLMERKGFTKGKDWVTRKYVGHKHNEIYWRKRLDVPLMFLLRE